MAAGRAAVAASGKRVQQAEKAIEDYLGGPGTHRPSNAGDLIVTRGGKKVRFDIKNSGKDKPHFHLQRQRPNGKWRDDGPVHRHYFKEDQL